MCQTEYRNICEAKCQILYEIMSDRILIRYQMKMLEPVQDRISERPSEIMSDKTSEYMSDKVSDRMPERILAKMSGPRLEMVAKSCTS